MSNNKSSTSYLIGKFNELNKKTDIEIKEIGDDHQKMIDTSNEVLFEMEKLFNKFDKNTSKGQELSDKIKNQK